MTKRQIDAVWVQQDPTIVNDAKKIADLARKHRLPAIGFSGYVQARGLIDCGVNFPRLIGRAAYFVNKILKGTKPEDIPVEQLTVFDRAINMNAAKVLGIQIPYFCGRRR